MPKHIVLNAGMHRSGTSMVNRLLNLHGMHIPLEIEYADEFNPSGYWESFELQHINDLILKMGDSIWSDTRAFDRERFLKADDSKLKSMVEHFLDKLMNSDSEIILLKDPRMCRLIPLWLEFLEPTGARVAAVFPVRNPLEVASSLRNRDRFGIETGLQLWLRNVLEAEFATRELPRVFFEYRQALSAWPDVFRKIQRTLDLPHLRQPEEIEAEIQKFASGALKHWAFGTDNLIEVAGKDSPVTLAYAAIRELSLTFSPRVLEELDTIREKMDALGSVDDALGRIKRAKQILGMSTSELTATDDSSLFSNLLSVLEKLRVTVDDQSRMNQLLESSEARSRQLEAELDDSSSAMAKLESEHSTLTTRFRKVDERLSELEAENATQSLRLKDLETNLDTEKENNRQLQGAMARERQLSDTLARQKDTLSAITDYQNRSLEKLKRHSDLTENELRRSVASLRDTLSRTQANEREQTRVINEMYAEMQSLSNAYLGLQDSLSWKLTKPVRSALSLLKRAAPVPGGAAVVLGAAGSELLHPVDEVGAPNGEGTVRPAEAEPAPSPEPAPVDPHPLIQAEVSGRQFVAASEHEPVDAEVPVKLIAFYLPQFHRIPENDEWWGEGFTEWTNVRPARPVFGGHYQPRLPGELGYYDLLDDQVQQRQVELAQKYGIGGFCFYFYWFHGKRLLEQPVIQYRENPKLRLPYCLCWANENWSRTWDGLDEHVLIGQEHSPEDDIAFIECVSDYFEDERYIRVTGRPMLLVYRPSLLPDAKATAERWRNWCRQNGFGEIFLAYTQSFEIVDPAELGFDAAIEFPPNNTAPDVITRELVTIDPEFRGYVYDYNSLMARSYRYEEPGYTLFRGVTPSWDNIARRPETGAVFSGTTPERYREWLRNAIADTVLRFEEPSERLVFINAWNEWAEGAYLEPDGVYGHAYLEATREATRFPRSCTGKALASRGATAGHIGLVIHDAHPHGSQYLTLNLARSLNCEFGFEVELVVLLSGGALLEEFEKWATVHLLDGADPLGPAGRILATHLRHKGVEAAIANTTVSGLFTQTLTEAGIRCVSLVHELPEIIRSYQLEKHAETIARHAESVVFAVPQVAQSFKEFASTRDEQVVIRPQGLYKVNRFRNDVAAARRALRSDLDLEPDARIILGVGFLDHRKGVDLFVKAGFQVIEAVPDSFMVWVGYWNAEMQAEVETLLDGHPLKDRFLFTGHRHDTDLFYAGADVFALPSREDPFPSTVMEALEVRVPVVAFRGAGGAEILLDRGCGLLAAYEQVDAFATCIVTLLKNPDEAKRLGATGAEIVTRELSFRHYVFDLLDLLGHPQKRVSAIVPNYNYAHYLEERISSIVTQSYPIFELIVIDDCSTDDSVEVIQKALAASPVTARLIVNGENSGSVFTQWRRGVEEARGDYVWICEADDSADPGFLRLLSTHFDDQDVVFAYSQSRQIDESGELIEENYLDYTNDVDAVHWLEDFVADGKTEIARHMAVKNCIPNVSAVVFRKDPLRLTLHDCQRQLASLKVAGDWLVYVQLMAHGKVGFCAKSLNAHRRHGGSVTISRKNNEIHMAEIHFMQNFVAQKYAVDDETKSKARAFVEHACRHLDLDPGRDYTLRMAGDDASSKTSPPPKGTLARAIAFYLPQFHPIPENDRWWGKGFTEWSNVSRATPLFDGHEQPQLPADLGFYDLRLEDTRMQQAELARRHGIEGFCYWHYWFNGQRLLERPFNEVLRSGKPDFPFCLAWANESWSRRWLGEEKDVLMAQTYSRDDDLEHARWLADAFADPRYIRCRNRPLFLVYRPTDLPDPRSTVDAIKETCVRRGLPEPFLVGINGHDRTLDARDVGFDATLHFMPQLGVLPDAFTDGPLASRKKRNAELGVESEVTKVYDYGDALKQMLELRQSFDHPTIPSVFVGWDNTPRRKENAIVMVNHTIEAFERALSELVENAQDQPADERLLFINAWNEWAEGNHLEPDHVNGRGFLEATLRALTGRA